MRSEGSQRFNRWGQVVVPLSPLLVVPGIAKGEEGQACAVS